MNERTVNPDDSGTAETDGAPEGAAAEAVAGELSFVI
jgi:hypothetical protein